MKFKRILLKLSGESLGGEKGYGFDAARLSYFAEEIKKAWALGCEIGLVPGGGNIFRGARNEGLNTGRVCGDYMGMLGTLINAMALQDELERRKVPTALFSGLQVDRLCDHPTEARIKAALADKKVVLLAGGTGNPFFTTDSAAALRAAEMEADVLLKGTRVDGIYSDDPEKNPGAEKYKRITFSQAINENLKIMDTTAFTLCRENNIPILVFNFSQAGALQKIVQGENIGSMVCP